MAQKIKGILRPSLRRVITSGREERENEVRGGLHDDW